jgi:hypothetical protein
MILSVLRSFFPSQKCPVKYGSDFNGYGTMDIWSLGQVMLTVVAFDLGTRVQPKTGMTSVFAYALYQSVV